MEVLLYNYVWPKKQSGYISGVCETEQKHVLYIVFQEGATLALMQATSSVKCKKKKHRQINELILSYLQISPKRKKTILHSQLTSENPLRSVANE